MTGADVDYIRKCLKKGLIGSPCLELGAGYGGGTNRELLSAAGIEYFGTDMAPGNGIDYVADFEKPVSDTIPRLFDSILILNVLEHTFDPIRVLDHAFTLVRPSGTCVIITPAVWTLHDFPFDCWRINPNFYEEYCRRNSLMLIEDSFEYVGYHAVRVRKDEGGAYVLPSPWQGSFKSTYSRIVHKVLNTYGRGMFFPSHVAIGVVIRKPA